MKLGGNPMTLVMGRIALAFFRMLQLRYRLRGVNTNDKREKATLIPK